MNLRHRSGAAEMNPSSMADIAFLLLTFFMVTTVMKDEKGLPLLLPPYQEHPISQPVQDRNLFKIQINSQDMLLVNGEARANLEGIRDEIKSFILNNGKLPTLSDNPQKAIVSLKADRGTSYNMFLKVLDETQGVYYEIYAGRVGLTAEQYRELDLNIKSQKLVHDRGREGIPMNISIAEPTGVD